MNRLEENHSRTSDKIAGQPVKGSGKRIEFVIGSNFGDEGKGVMTDYLCRRERNPLVIRFNSGPQAGHTVITADGRRHVFGHFGAGSLAGAPVYLSRFFAVNPILFCKEREELAGMTELSGVYVDENCRITTPYDMLLNQIAERRRGSARHGSCGLGFYETVLRNKLPEFGLTVKQAAGGELKERLLRIRNEYVSLRLREEGMERTLRREEEELLSSNGIFQNFCLDVEEFLADVTVITLREAAKDYDTLVMEGAQGLMLDQDYPYFPHVTPSRTGLPQALTVLSEAGLTGGEEKPEAEVIYVTRCYLTRHGAGPMPDEREKPYERILDPTNQPNPWQGSLRFGLLDPDLLAANTEADFQNFLKEKDRFAAVTKSAAVTCLDQADGSIRFLERGQETCLPEDEFLETVRNRLSCGVVYSGRGGRAEDVFC